MIDASFQKTWDIFQAAWSDLPAEKRRALLNESVTDDCVYSDPTDA